MTILRDNDALRQAQARMRLAKAAFTEAARQALRGDQDAALKASKALGDVTDARAQLRQLGASEARR